MWWWIRKWSETSKSQLRDQITLAINCKKRKNRHTLYTDPSGLPGIVSQNLLPKERHMTSSGFINAVDDGDWWKLFPKVLTIGLTFDTKWMRAVISTALILLLILNCFVVVYVALIRRHSSGRIFINADNKHISSFHAIRNSIFIVLFCLLTLETGERIVVSRYIVSR